MVNHAIDQLVVSSDCSNVNYSADVDLLLSVPKASNDSVNQLKPEISDTCGNEAVVFVEGATIIVTDVNQPQSVPTVLSDDINQPQQMLSNNAVAQSANSDNGTVMLASVDCNQSPPVPDFFYNDVTQLQSAATTDLNCNVNQTLISIDGASMIFTVAVDQQQFILANSNHEINQLQLGLSSKDGTHQVNSREGIIASSVDMSRPSHNGEAKRARRGHPNKSDWKREANKYKRMKGESYVGFAKNELGAYKQTSSKEPRRMGPPCCCKKGREGKLLKCSELSENVRNEIFQTFWSQMNWDQRKVFVSNNVDIIKKQRTRTEAETSRREQSYVYHLKHEERRKRVCKLMFLSTLCLGEWSVRSWMEDSNSGMHSEVGVRHAARKNKPESDGRTFIGLFLNSLPKMESHYCRASTTKLFLEPVWNSHAAVYQEYAVQCSKKGVAVMSRKIFTDVFNGMNLSLFSPKKDQCDVCAMHSVGNLTDVAYSEHCQKKEKARSEKYKDKEDAISDQTKLVYTMDLEAVMLCPLLKASALYYKTKLAVHNFTLFNLADKTATCYVWHEGEGGLVASVFATLIVKFLENELALHNDVTQVTLFSDGCTYQNRNAIVSNAILQLAVKNRVTIYQKFLEKGHTQMECDSMHSTIERQLRKRDIQVPSDYVQIIKSARQVPHPYAVVYLDHKFFQDFTKNLVYPSIRPGNKVGDPTVTDIRALRYSTDNTISFKTDFADDYIPLPKPRRATTTSQSPAATKMMYNESIPIKTEKFVHLQQLKKVILPDHHHFYDSLRHVCTGQCNHLISSSDSISAD